MFPFDLIYPSPGTRKAKNLEMPIRTDKRFKKHLLLPKQKEERRKENPVFSSLGNKNGALCSGRSPWKKAAPIFLPAARAKWEVYINILSKVP